MNTQQEYDQFMVKLAKTAKDIHDDFTKLSPEAQFRIRQEVNAFLRQFGHAISAQDLAQRFFGEVGM